MSASTRNRAGVLLCLVGALATGAFGRTNLWVGAASGGNWGESANWRTIGPTGTGPATYDLSALTNGALVSIAAPVEAAGLVVRGEAGDARAVTFKQGVSRTELGAAWRFENTARIGDDATVPSVAPLIVDRGSTLLPTLVPDGVSGRAIHFGNDKNQGAKLACYSPNRASLPTGNGPFTVSLWIRPTTASGYGPNFLHVGPVYWNDEKGQLDIGWGANTFFFGSVIDGSRKPFKSIGFYACGWSRSGKHGHTNEVAVAQLSTPLTDGLWHHIVGTYEKRVMRIYVDGTLRDSVTRTNDIWITSSVGIQLSNWAYNGDHNHQFVGDMDEVQWLKGAWSAAQVKAEYEARGKVFALPTSSFGPVEAGPNTTIVLEGGTQMVSRVTLEDGATLDSAGGALILAEGAELAFNLNPIGETPALSASEPMALPQAARMRLTNQAAGDSIDARAKIIHAPSLITETGAAPNWTLAPTIAAEPPATLVLTTDNNHCDEILLTAGNPIEARASRGGNFVFASPAMTFKPLLQMGQEWNYQGFTLTNSTINADGTVSFLMAFTASNCTARGLFRYERVNTNALRLTWTLTANTNITLCNLGISFTLANSAFGGGRAVCLDTDGNVTNAILPEAYGKQSVCQTKNARTARFYTKNESDPSLTLTFDPLVKVDIHDGRAWREQVYSIRLLNNGTQKFEKDVTLTYGVTVELPRNIYLHETARYVAKQDHNWIPIPAFAWPKAGTALDFSALCGNEKPAGKYGRVVRRGAHFEFENRPGVPQRFYGPNLVSSAVAPKEGEAAFAAGMARLGYNTVRLHHHEAQLINTNDDGAIALDATKMDRFDRLVAACVTNGLYITTDLFTSRSPIRWRSIGITKEKEDAALESSDFKALVLVYEPLCSNFVAFTKNFLGHTNPYLGRSLAKEPALIGLSIVNEGAISSTPGTLAANYPSWREAWEAWSAEKRQSDPATYASVTTDLAHADTRFFRRFVQEKEQAFAARMRRVVEDLGCQAPLTSLNGCSYQAAYMQVRADCYDYEDDHYYYDHPGFLQTSWTLPSSHKNTNPLLSDEGVLSLVPRRHFGMPYCVTEFNFAGPNQYRAVGGLLMGALGAGQDWDGVWRFAWQHGGSNLAISTSTVGFFDLSGDPLNLASERAALCLYLRGDMAPLAKRGAVVIPPKDVSGPSTIGNTSLTLSGLRLAWAAQLGHVVSDTLPEGVSSFGDFQTSITNSAEALAATLGIDLAADRAVRVDSATGTLRVATGRTAGGFSSPGAFTAGPLTCTIDEAPACIWASSLTVNPLASSSHILLTHLTDAINTGMTFEDDSRTVLEKYGSLPVLMRRGTAVVRLALIPRRYRVYSLGTDGTRRRRIPCEISSAGVLTFTCDIAAEEQATFLYEIVPAPGLTVSIE